LEDYMKRDSNTYDIIIIGAGAGGLNIAGFANTVGLSTLLIDKNDSSIGGDCLNHGCIPSKALIHVARILHEGKAAERFGLSLSGEVDIKKIVEYIHEKKEHIRTHENAEYFRAKGMDVVLGVASFISSHEVEVGGVIYSAKKIVIATGSHPREFVVQGSDEAKREGKIFTNENIFSIGYIPKRLVVVGGGPIGVELGQAFNYLGSAVTIVGIGLLEKEDKELVAIVQNKLTQEGVSMKLGYTVESIQDNTVINIKNEDGHVEGIPFDTLLVSIGREISIGDLHVENAGIKINNHGFIEVNEYLETSNKDIVVCGDVAGGHMFTHAAEVHAGVIINNLFSPRKKKLSTDTMSWVTYTNPEIATFGLQEKTLQERAITYEVVEQNFSESDRAIVDEETEGLVKLFISTQGVVLGGTMVAKDAGEISAEMMFAQAHAMSLKDFMKKVYPYPTKTRVHRSLVLAYMGRSLTPFVKVMLRFLFRYIV
jgi:pyruvate/2-oxoglutarate dehydrogenase complex dihydrolipoamide dehydrogenase (E3) component